MKHRYIKFVTTERRSNYLVITKTKLKYNKIVFKKYLSNRNGNTKRKKICKI